MVTTTQQIEPELDETLHLIESYQRRRMLYRLEDADSDVIAFDGLVDAVLAQDTGSSDRAGVILDLFHNHLPVLEDAGWIEYDSRSDTIRYRPEGVPTELLSLIRDRESGP